MTTTFATSHRDYRKSTPSAVDNDNCRAAHFVVLLSDCSIHGANVAFPPLSRVQGVSHGVRDLASCGFQLFDKKSTLRLIHEIYVLNTAVAAAQGFMTGRPERLERRVFDSNDDHYCEWVDEIASMLAHEKHRDEPRRGLFRGAIRV